MLTCCFVTLQLYDFTISTIRIVLVKAKQLLHTDDNQAKLDRTDIQGDSRPMTNANKAQNNPNSPNTLLLIIDIIGSNNLFTHV
jgi:hypothetical protein